MKELKEFFDGISKESNLNFSGLFEYIKDKQIEIKLHAFPRPYHEAYAVSGPDAIYINKWKFESTTPVNQFHILLHEIGHYLRINKYGPDKFIKEVDNCQSHQEFFEHVFGEEKFAEKFALLMYYHFNRKIDTSSIQVDFNSSRARDSVYTYTLGMYRGLKETGISFFDFAKTILNIK